MKKRISYYGALDLKYLRHKRGWTVEQLADLVFCSSRTINRVEAGNRTSNFELARKYADQFGYPFEQLFIIVDQRLLDLLAATVPIVSLFAPLPKEIYYTLYFRRVSWFDANLWGKTKWIGTFDKKHELRILHELREGYAQELWESGMPVISTKEEWESYFYHAVIGHMEKIVASKTALKCCAPRALMSYAVEPGILFVTGVPDVILLGDYANVPEVFSLCSKRASAYRCNKRTVPF